mmetsp:Transcript_1105/g.1429  ORF Transcript_1105/g.1429 Transcript_1105/m.1429 type:complete len:210 (+) Transcript_1105:132-761(+)
MSNDSSNSYMNRLQQAKLRKNQGKELGESVPLKSPSQPSKKEKINHPPNIETHLQNSINILSKRLNTRKPLQRDDLNRFQDSIRIIIDDIKSNMREDSLIHDSTIQSSIQKNKLEEEDDFESEGAKWDPSKGYGMPTGTLNSYKIDGMENMSPDEYQEALRQRVLNRAQKMRKTGVYGNRAANAYLKFLNNKPSWDAKANVPDEDFKSY